MVTGVNVTDGLVYTNNPHGCRGVQSYEAFFSGFVYTSSPMQAEFGYLLFPDL